LECLAAITIKTGLYLQNKIKLVSDYIGNIFCKVQEIKQNHRFMILWDFTQCPNSWGYGNGVALYNNPALFLNSFLIQFCRKHKHSLFKHLKCLIIHKIFYQLKAVTATPKIMQLSMGYAHSMQPIM